MKREILLLMTFCMFSALGWSQNNNDYTDGFQPIEIPERTPALEALYAHGKYLELHGTVSEIRQNRIDIKNEWATISPEVAALYKPIELPSDVSDFVLSSNHYEEGSTPTINSWSEEDLLLRDGFVDGIDIDVDQAHGIFVMGYENSTGLGDVFIYKSNDNGGSFFLWADAQLNANIVKAKIISLDGGGEEYLLAYVLLDNGQFGVVRWNMHTGNLVDTATITTDVLDFSVDQNFPGSTQLKRVFATYIKEEGSCGSVIYSARSTSGSYGMEWVDEHNIYNTCSIENDISYGRVGAIYTVFIGFTTGNLYAGVNSDYNDPASWQPRETVEEGDVEESKNPVVAATKKSLGIDEVILITQSRDAGTSNAFSHFRYNREGESDFFLDQEGIPLPNNSVGPMDAWVRRAPENEIIRTSYISESTNNSFNARARSYTYDGDVLTDNEAVSDLDFEIWNGFAPAIAETPADNAPCMVFARVNGTRGYGLYFNRDTELLSVDSENANRIDYSPNPAQDRLHITSIQQMERIVLYTLTGQKVKEFSQTTTEATLDMQDLAAGLYLMTVYSADSNATFKIVKQ